MLLGLALFYVGAVLCLNGLWLLGRIGDNEIAVIDMTARRKTEKIDLRNPSVNVFFSMDLTPFFERQF
jgi:hypothetical protein